MNESKDGRTCREAPRQEPQKDEDDQPRPGPAPGLLKVIRAMTAPAKPPSNDPDAQ